ncbi:hypothetical protein AAV28_06495 [Bradyrhizobium diazoefficiens USDA 110]|nr:hypothetical protein AAV28_06495 [Bradyrhizobium diazoefficiens USDA 110]APO50559.1 hypothetical protein BD122_09925 [Bradyrhizobium diazoefficiens]
MVSGVIPVIQSFLGNCGSIAQRLEQGKDRLRIGFISCVALIMIAMRFPEIDLREYRGLALSQLDMILLHVSPLPA